MILPLFPPPYAQDPATRGLAESLVWSVGLKTFAHPTIATVSVLGQVRGRATALEDNQPCTAKT